MCVLIWCQLPARDSTKFASIHVGRMRCHAHPCRGGPVKPVSRWNALGVSQAERVMRVLKKSDPLACDQTRARSQSAYLGRVRGVPSALSTVTRAGQLDMGRLALYVRRPPTDGVPVCSTVGGRAVLSLQDEVDRFRAHGVDPGLRAVCWDSQTGPECGRKDDVAQPRSHCDGMAQRRQGRGGGKGGGIRKGREMHPPPEMPSRIRVICYSGVG